MVRPRPDKTTIRCRCLVLLVVLAVPAFEGCQSRMDTPPEVAQAYRTLVNSLDPSTPGASFARLEGFASQHARYAIADAIEQDRTAWRSRLDSAYLQARDLVRDEQFDQAEAILKDLTLASNEKAGKLSKDFLAFEFHQMKATRLLQRGDTEAAQGVLKQLTRTDLDQDQMVAAQRLLDSTSVVGMAAQMTRTTAIQSAARTLLVFLHGAYADNGRYPEALTLDSAELASLRDGGSLGVVGSIDDYRATPDTFSLILTGKDPRQRIRITQTGIAETP